MENLKPEGQCLVFKYSDINSMLNNAGCISSLEIRDLTPKCWEKSIAGIYVESNSPIYIKVLQLMQEELSKDKLNHYLLTNYYEGTSFNFQIVKAESRFQALDKFMQLFPKNNAEIRLLAVKEKGKVTIIDKLISMPYILIEQLEKAK